MAIKVLISGGGTGGHINPALSIAECLKNAEKNIHIEFCGTEKGLENELIPAAGYKLNTIRAAGLPSKPSVKMLKAILELRAGQKMSRSLISAFQPDVIVGTGGYVCSPLVSVAFKENIPVLLHEQNAFPGRANRLLSGKANIVCTSFPDMEKDFPRCKEIYFTGNPIRESFFTQNREKARKELDLPEDTFFILAMGGSLGAQKINQTIVALSRKLSGKKIKIILSAGKRQEALPEMKESAGNLEILQYIDNPALYMAAADLFIGRAGANTCAEVAAAGAPSIFIPYPFAAGNHQMYNAMRFEETGAGYVLTDDRTDTDNLMKLITPIFENKNLSEKMSSASKKLAQKDAGIKIAEKVLHLAKKNVE